MTQTARTAERLLPQNIEAECGVLGSIIIDPEALVLVADFLRAEDFYRDAHRQIYEVMLHLYTQQRAADFITICDVLASQSKLEEVGGASYITSLVNQVPTSGNALYYARIVERTATLRRLIGAAAQIAASAYEAEDDATGICERAEQLVFEVTQRALSLGTDASLAELLTSYMGRLDQLSQRRASIVGVPTGFAALDRLTGGLRRSDLIILAARPSLGKCLTSRTLIDDPRTGERLTIEECVSRRLPIVYGVSEDGRVRPTPIADWIDSGIQPCYRVQTKTGRMVEVTDHHPFLTVHGWRSLHDLRVGQYIAVPTKVACFGDDESLPLEKVRLLAYFIAEGGLTNHLPKFTNTDPEIVEDFKKIIALHFPVCSIKQYGIDYAVAQPRNATTMQGGGILPKNPVTVWLTELGLMGKLVKDKSFPPCVWKWSRRYLAEFLRVLMSCDGSIYSYHERPVIEMSIASPRLAAEVHHAFVRFGIVSKLYKKVTMCQGKVFNAWRIEITNPESIRIYQEEIGWIGEKRARFAGYERKVLKEDGGNKGHAPQETWELVRAAVGRQGLSWIELARRSGETTRRGKYAGYNPHTNRNVPRYRLAAYAEVLNDSHLRWIASPDIYWDEIVSIEAIGEHQVYDLSVPDGANFVAQDVFVHNTSLALSLARNAALQYGQRIGIFSLEMSQEQLTERLMAMEARIDLQRLSTGNIEDYEWERIVVALGRLSDAQIRIDGTSVLSPIQMRSRARRWVVEHGLDLIIVDYLQLMQPGELASKRKMENRVLVIDEISRNLKLLARELNIPILALAQLSRAVEARVSKVPQLSDLRECVVGRTRLIDAKTGKWKPLTQIQPGDKVLGLGKHQKIGSFVVENVWSTGKKPVYHLTTHTGRQITATANHPFLTASGWRPLEELQIGERIATALRLPEHGKEMPERADLCRFLGYMVGDGTYQKHRGIGIISSDPETFEDAVTIALAHFPDITLHAHTCRGNTQEIYFSGIHANGYGRPHGNSLREWIHSLGIFGQKDATKHVPEWVFEAGRTGACEFLAGYLSSDGCVQRAMDSKRKPWSIQFDTVSRQLANDIQALLLRIGVIASVDNGSFSSKATQPIYRVAVAASAHNLRRFAEQVHPCGKKGRLLHEMIEALPQSQTKPGVFALPLELSAYLASCVVGQASQVTTWQWAHGKRQVSRDVVAYWANKLANPTLAEWAEGDLLWEPIRSIEPVGEEEVFDICVPGCANFLANGIVAHNSGSIEMNADIVMFIYRDEVYTPGSQRQGIADIIVAKHRNGPTGNFCLRFEPQTTRFCDVTDEVVAPLAPLERLEIEMDESEDD
jgi:replicative DNA helicase